jgi:DNA-binding transcriptional ArsR family regulator/uncharacterized protein YndB with AHSA1/START domain
MTDRIEKTIELNAPISRVWRALTNHEEFGQWFRVCLDGPFAPGAASTGKMSYPGFEGWPWLATVERMDYERLFSFRWHDFDEKAGVDIADQPTTLVEFRLEPTATGTRLTITESGFDSNSPIHEGLTSCGATEKVGRFNPAILPLMSPPEQSLLPAEAAPVFAALGDPTRLHLLSRLVGGRPLSITQLAGGTALSRQGVSKHLSVLERAGVVASERVGRESRFTLNPTALAQAQSYLHRVSAQWDDALFRLKAHLG